MPREAGTIGLNLGRGGGDDIDNYDKERIGAEKIGGGAA